ncbi:hypothetical protein DFH06DRAFT_541391 [Mycena polygramma]|nr:hypothetical protein DFH06DRAFT_541391 [Mycena polygramma]
MYTPNPGVNFESATEYYQTTDPAVNYSSGWAVSTAANSSTPEPRTQTNGAQVSLNFYGTSVTPYSVIPAEVPYPSASGRYTIDNGSPITFELGGISANMATAYYQPLFTTPSLSNGPHNLVLTYGGDAAHIPLVVMGFVVTSNNGTVPSTSSASSPTSSSASLKAPSRHSSTAAIAGGVVGGLVLLALAAGLAFWLRKRNRPQQVTEVVMRPKDMINGEVLPLAHHTYTEYNYPPARGTPFLRPEAVDSSSGYTELTGSHDGSSRDGDTSIMSRTALVASQQAALGKIARETATTERADHPEDDVVLVRHEDSGLRVAQSDAPGPRIVDLPPGYTQE